MDRQDIRFYNGLYRLFTKNGLRSFSTYADAIKDENAWEESSSYTSEGDLQQLFDRRR